MKWLIAMLILVLVLLTLNFGAISAWMAGTFSFLSATACAIILVAVLLVLAVVLAILCCKNPEWFNEICADIGGGAKAIISGATSGVTTGLFGEGIGRFLGYALLGVGGYYGIKLYLNYRKSDKNSEDELKYSNSSNEFLDTTKEH